MFYEATQAWSPFTKDGAIKGVSKETATKDNETSVGTKQCNLRGQTAGARAAQPCRAETQVDVCIWVQRFWLFYKMEPPRPEMDVKWDSKAHCQELHFSVTFLLITFFARVFLQFFQRIQNQHKILRVLIPILHLWKIKFSGAYMY